MAPNNANRDAAQNQNNQPTESKEFASAGDLRPQRDGEGERVPEDVETESSGWVKILPMNYGDVNKYFEDDNERPQSPPTAPTAPTAPTPDPSTRGQSPADRNADAANADPELENPRDHEDLDESEMAEIFTDFVSQPDLIADARELQKRMPPTADALVVQNGNEHVLTEAYIAELNPLAVRDLLLAVMDASGIREMMDVEATENAENESGVSVQQKGN